MELEITLEDPQDFGTRIDRLLARELLAQGHEVSRSLLARSFERQEVWVGQRAVKASHKIEAPAVVRVVLPAPAPLARAFAEPLPLCVLYEDAQVLVVDKAAGMVVHASAGHDRGTLVNAVLHHLQCSAEQLPVLPGNGPERPGVVHRLDKDTSGAMIFAKTLKAQRSLAQQFRDHAIGRQYLAICRGVAEFSAKRIESGHGRDPKERKRFAPVGPRRAVSTFYCVDSGAGASLLACRLSTGRTHQIRMHARALGHPLLADALYGTRAKDPGLLAIEQALGRHALHAQLLAFDHPVSGERIALRSELSADLQQALDQLGLSLDGLGRLAPLDG